MDKSEPALEPQWLRSSGNASNLSASALLHSDDHPLSKQSQQRSSPVLEKTTSAYLRRSSSSNGSANLRSSRSLSKNQLDRHYDDESDYLDKEKLAIGNHRSHSYSRPLDNIPPSKSDKDKLLGSHSMIARKQDDTLSRNVIGNLTNVNGIGPPYRIAGNSIGTSFEQDYPSLGTEEKQGSIVRVSSPVLSTGIHNGNSGIAYNSSRKLVVTVSEAPVVTGSSSPQVASPTPLPNTGLNMAEALAQSPSRARTPPQSTGGMPRFEELAIRQAKLIPVTPMPKSLLVSPSEKSKPKIGQHQNSLHLLNRTRSPGRPDTTQNSNERRLQILKPTRELNGVSSSAKDSSSPTKSTPLAASTAVPVRSIGSNTASAAQRYPSVFRQNTEKKSTNQVQSRNEFFNHLKKTSSAKKSDESVLQVAATSVTESGRDISSSYLCEDDKRGVSVHNGDACLDPCKVNDGEKDFSSDVTAKLDEEEAAFLRSLGWDENAVEDEGLTEEEIRAFCEKYKTRLPSCKVHPSIEQPIVPTGSCGKRDGISSHTPSCSSDSESDC